MADLICSPETSALNQSEATSLEVIVIFLNPSTPGIAKYMPSDTLVPLQDFRKAHEIFKKFKRSFKCLF
jgi:hypothetical protein